MPKWIKSIYIRALGHKNKLKRAAFFKIFNKGKLKYKLWTDISPHGTTRYSIQEFVNMKEKIKNGTVD